MKRPLLYVSMLVCLLAGCATRPASESQALVLKATRGQTAHLNCGPGAMRFCEVDIVDKSKTCSCVDNHAILIPR